MIWKLSRFVLIFFIYLAVQEERGPRKSKASRGDSGTNSTTSHSRSGKLKPVTRERPPPPSTENVPVITGTPSQAAIPSTTTTFIYGNYLLPPPPPAHAPAVHFPISCPLGGHNIDCGKLTLDNGSLSTTTETLGPGPSHRSIYSAFRRVVPNQTLTITPHITPFMSSEYIAILFKKKKKKLPKMSHFSPS